MKTCDEAQAALVELFFADLDDAAEARLNEHLLSCPACRLEEKRLLDLRDGVRAGPLGARDDLKERIRAALPRPGLPRALVVLGRPVPAYVAVAAGLVGALLVAALPARHEPRVEPVRDASEPAGIVLAGGRLPFTVASPYGTQVALASPAQNERPPSPSRLHTPEDSL